jgi:hypothetical protein
MKEIWKTIPDFKFYVISNLGRVKRVIGPRCRRERMLKPRLINWGYNTVCLRKNGPYYRTIHQLVMLTFVGTRQRGMQVNHKNGVKTDNRLENLEYCTVSENSRHALITGLRKIARGEDAGRTILTESQVHIIRARVISGESHRRIAKDYGISHTQVGQIARRTSRSWLD